AERDRENTGCGSTGMHGRIGDGPRATTIGRAKDTRSCAAASRDPHVRRTLNGQARATRRECSFAGKHWWRTFRRETTPCCAAIVGAKHEQTSLDGVTHRDAVAIVPKRNCVEENAALIRVV